MLPQQGKYLDSYRKISNLIVEIGLSVRLKELGIKTDEDIEIIAKDGFNHDGIKSNPRKLTKEALRKMLEEIR